MSIAELKLGIYELLASTKDSKLLNSIYKTLKSQKIKKNSDWWNTISLEEKAAIEEGLAQLERGEIISHEEVIKESKKILKKYSK